MTDNWPIFWCVERTKSLWYLSDYEIITIIVHNHYNFSYGHTAAEFFKWLLSTALHSSHLFPDVRRVYGDLRNYLFIQCRLHSLIILNFRQKTVEGDHLKLKCYEMSSKYIWCFISSILRCPTFARLLSSLWQLLRFRWVSIETSLLVDSVMFCQNLDYPVIIAICGSEWYTQSTFAT